MCISSGKGRKGEGVSITMHSELGNQVEDPVSFYLSDFFMAARPPQAGTCCGCQPEGLKFPQLAEPMLRLRKQEGEGAAVN